MTLINSRELVREKVGQQLCVALLRLFHKCLVISPTANGFTAYLQLFCNFAGATALADKISRYLLTFIEFY